MLGGCRADPVDRAADAATSALLPTPQKVAPDAKKQRALRPVLKTNLCSRVARFLMVHDTKTAKMYQMYTICTKWQ
jgi:hypothetical protein